MGLPNLVPPVTSPHRDHSQLSQNDSTTNGGGDFLAALDAKSNVAITIIDDNEGLETGTLIGMGLLLNGHDFDLVLEARVELVDDLVLLDWEGMEVDLLQRLNLLDLTRRPSFVIGTHFSSSSSRRAMRLPLCPLSP